MSSSERLAAYLAEELSADERRALEADLAADPRLRAELDAMRRADAALSALTPSALPDGARQRLLTTLGATFDDELGGAGATGPVPGDELAERRRRSPRRTWLTAAGGVAAAVIAAAIVVPNLTFSGDDSGEAAMDSGADTMMAESDDSAAGTASALLAGPVLTGGDRELDPGTADELLASPELESVASRGLTPEDAAMLGIDWALALGGGLGAGGDASPFATPEDDEASDEDAQLEEAPAEEAFSDTARAGAELRVGPEVDDAGRADVARCLDTLLATGDLAIPVTAELVTFDGEPAIAFGLVGLDADGEVARREVWVLARDSCDVRYFGQR
ncbi:MAG: hypothetical protein WEB03_16660 [Nitriliruptor sp.]|uniref:anti-sigma factor n=1 Tax=Nitriliruptor sp. TaxID=2448056 RepID=UPI0034A0A4B4